jgi:Photosynthetic reaction centre cytochrome C subunit
MKKLPIFGILAALFVLLMSQSPPQNPPPSGPPPGGGRGPGRVINQDSLIKEREKAMAASLEYIKGKEKMPADSVFKNIKSFKGLAAERMIGIMGKWSEAMGTGCNGCHNPQDYASDEKDEKETARAMLPMTRKLNDELLKTIKGLEKSKGVSCMTCHRGRKHPNQ